MSDKRWDAEAQGLVGKLWVTFPVSHCGGRVGVSVEMDGMRGGWVIPIESLRRMVADFDAAPSEWKEWR